MNGLLTVDVGTTSAFCFGITGCLVPTFGTHQFLKPKEVAYEPALDWAFSQWMIALIDQYHPAVFAIELPWIPHDSNKLNRSVFRIVGFSRLAMMIAHSMGLDIKDWTITQVAKHFGAGGLPSAAKKARTRAIVEQRYGWPCANEDESDAVAVWIFTEAKLDQKASAKRPLGELFTAEAVKPRRKRIPAQGALAL
jgi:Holliday junction resolvasome RuvABC endonuclease subunit